MTSSNLERGGLYIQTHINFVTPLTGEGGETNTQTTFRLFLPTRELICSLLAVYPLFSLTMIPTPPPLWAAREFVKNSRPSKFRRQSNACWWRGLLPWSQSSETKAMATSSCSIVEHKQSNLGINERTFVHNKVG